MWSDCIMLISGARPYIFSEIQGRQVSDGDYILFKYDFGDEIFSRTIGKVVNGEIEISNKVDLKNVYIPQDYLLCYKIDNPLDLNIDLTNSDDLISYPLLKNMNYYTILDKSIQDLLGRQINLGDFVLYSIGGGRRCHYGIVIDDKYVFTDKYVKKKVNMVFKIVTPIQKELDIYNQIHDEYLKLQHNLIKSSFVKKFKDLKPGDAFRKNNNLHIYLGEYKLNAYHSFDKIESLNKLKKCLNDTNCKIDSKHFIYDVNKLLDNKQKVFLSINLEYKKSKKFLDKLRNKELSKKELQDFIVNSGLIYGYTPSKYGCPRILKFNLSEKRTGDYIESFDISYNNLFIRYDFNNPVSNKFMFDIIYTLTS